MSHSLKQIRDIANHAIQSLRWETSINQTAPSTVYLAGCDSMRNTVEIIQTLGLFDNHVNALLQSQLFQIPGDRIRIPSTEADKIIEVMNSLKVLAKELTKAIDQVLPPEQPTSINIKLPPVNDFDELSQYARDFHIALTQVLYLDGVDGAAKIESVENGSIWLNVLLYTSLSTTVIGGLVWSAAVVYKKILEARMMAQQLQALTLRTDSMEDVKIAQKSALQHLIQTEAELISSSTFKENLPENIERIKGSIKLLAELMDKGAEVHPAIGAPEEVANLYPNMKALPTLESRTKLLANP